jgi:peroxiredoxin
MTEQNKAIEVGQPAPDVTLRNQDDAPVTLSSFWTQRPTALVFVRHFG